MKEPYPIDLKEEEWEIIEPLLPVAFGNCEKTARNKICFGEKSVGS
jgi:hypothetical protein